MIHLDSKETINPLKMTKPLLELKLISSDEELSNKKIPSSKESKITDETLRLIRKKMDKKE